MKIIGDEGAKALGDGLKINSSLTELNLGVSLHYLLLLIIINEYYYTMVIILELKEQRH